LKQTAFVTQTFLDDLSSQAEHSPRLRKNYNFHLSDDDICHRLLNAMEPGSYIQPHRHQDLRKDEALVALRGRIGLILFDGRGRVENKAVFAPDGPVTMVDIPHGTYHTLVSLERGSVFFEAKGGPYRPLTEEEKAPWAPEEGQERVHEYLLSLCREFDENGLP